MKNRLLTLMFIVTVVVSGGYGILQMRSLGVASAQGAGSGSGSAVVPGLAHDDPTAHPLETATDAWAAVKQFGYVWGGMIVLFAIGSVIVRKADDNHWLSKDHTLPILTGLLGTLGAALQAKFAGGSWAVVPMTLMGTVLLIFQKPASKPAS